MGKLKRSIKLLEQAVVAYRAALEEFTRERVPLGWARTQNNLGIALQELGDHQIDTSCLKEAVTAYRAALEELNRELLLPELHNYGTACSFCLRQRRPIKQLAP